MLRRPPRPTRRRPGEWQRRAVVAGADHDRVAAVGGAAGRAGGGSSRWPSASASACRRTPSSTSSASSARCSAPSLAASRPAEAERESVLHREGERGRLGAVRFDRLGHPVVRAGQHRTFDDQTLTGFDVGHLPGRREGDLPGGQFCSKVWPTGGEPGEGDDLDRAGEKSGRRRTSSCRPHRRRCGVDLDGSVGAVHSATQESDGPGESTTAPATGVASAEAWREARAATQRCGPQETEDHRAVDEPSQPGQSTARRLLDRHLGGGPVDPT